MAKKKARKPAATVKKPAKKKTAKRKAHKRELESIREPAQQ
jgi:hypothetical protein